MKTIEIQKDTRIYDSVYVIINGEKHRIPRQHLRIQVANDKPFEVRARWFFGGSPKYLFEPKDNMVIQVLANQRFMNWFLIIFGFGLILTFVLKLFFGNHPFIMIFQCIILLYFVINFLLMRRKYFVIKEFV